MDKDGRKWTIPASTEAKLDCWGPQPFRSHLRSLPSVRSATLSTKCLVQKKLAALTLQKPFSRSIQYTNPWGGSATSIHDGHLFRIKGVCDGRLVASIGRGFAVQLRVFGRIQSCHDNDFSIALLIINNQKSTIVSR